MSSHPAKPVGIKFWSSGAVTLFVLMWIGLAFTVARFTKGIGFISNLSDAWPWGWWVAVDVEARVALSAGGFTTAALGYVLGRRYYASVIRPALLIATLGYTSMVLGLVIDVGRPWALYNPLIHPQPNSLLFEVAMCVMCYLTVLYTEFLPVLIERFSPRFVFLKILERFLQKVMWIFIVLGVVLSCMHQSSLGGLALPAPSKINPLWYTPLLPLLFLSSAIAVGFPMVIFERVLMAKWLRLKPEMEVLSRLSRFIVFLLGIYMVLKIGDLIYRGAYTHLLDGTPQSICFLVEVIFGVIVPWCLFLLPQMRRTKWGIFIPSCLVILGVLMNRINVFIVGVTPPYGEKHYFPSIGEFATSLGLLAGIVFVYRIATIYLPVISIHAQEKRP
ncbi:MAG TPA: Ni/Fe-hydrogenase cytochrome b subunit [Candidatus Sumerlaeota bacterium]|nr:Ni/Fe-hydrogenase cytochrome b subunit [Candidatus Sumerlaeota bacterium]HPS02891.1 Ni/Fe-hydrogenase cytochrome b subunit [Candidatus Sumerlaeota bacterium]